MMQIAFAPSFPWPVLAALAAAILLIGGYALWRRARGAAWRIAAALVLLAALADPVLVEQERTPVDDVVAVVVDESRSQRIGDRAAETEAAVERLTERLGRVRGIETRVIRGGADGDGTALFDALDRGLANVPRGRIGATFLVTDGQVHDAPVAARDLAVPGPVHTLLTGAPGERDRRLVVERAPRFGLVGRTVEVEVSIRDPDGGAAEVELRRDGAAVRSITVPAGRSVRIPFRLEHAGANILQLQASSADGEIFDGNNRAVVQVNGVRERLRVLLVSGEPHAGERVWRNFLKADPSVDLIHFTILRPPDKQDSTPVRELALIAFPVRELFEEKIDEFDLIIFDRYHRRGVLPGLYFENIVRYVQNGGAVLNVAGPAAASPLGLHRTALGDILPGRPSGPVIEGGLRPRITLYGRRHPVTADLVGADGEGPRWGRWFRQVAAAAGRGETLMDGAGSRPLLILDRIGEGRVAQLLSDHIWLWARGFEGGGPHAEILRRLAHWLMKEPGLEEEAIGARVEGNELMIVSRSASDDHGEITVTAPSGAARTLILDRGAGGRAKAVMPVEEIGIYRIGDGRRSAMIAVGNPNPREFADMRASPEPLAGVRALSGGGLAWLRDGLPDIRRVRPDRPASGSQWMGVVANRDYRVVSVHETPLLPPLAVLLLGLGMLAWAWRREGR